MKRILPVAFLAAFALVSGCSNRAAEIYDNAQFEEVQNNKEHALKLYEEIVRKYPDSEQAKKARERLAALREGR